MSDLIVPIIRGAAILYLAGAGIAAVLFAFAYGVDWVWSGRPFMRRRRDDIVARLIAFTTWGTTFLVVAWALGSRT